MSEVKVNVERLTGEFVRLAEIPSPSFREQGLATYLKKRLTGLGLQVQEDEAGRMIGGDSGNLIATLPGDDRYVGVFFACHMDTVVPAEGIKVVFQDGIFRSGGDTVLGGDDKAGIAAIIEALEMIRESGLPHGPVEVILTIGEEQGLQGSKHLDCSRLRSRFGFVLDSVNKPGTIIIEAPCQNILYFTIKGRAAHAGEEPEKGINAIQVAGKVLAELPLGRIDQETTSNIGVITGGRATNIVPDSCYMHGETRSLKREKMDALTSQIVDKFHSIVEGHGARGEVRVEFQYPELHLDQELPVVRLAARAARNLGLEVRYEATGGGSDANIFNAAGIPTANLGIGMSKIHTTEEYLEQQDLINDARLICEIIRLTAAGGDAAS